MKKKRVAFIIESLQLGGAEKSLVTLLSNLDYSKLSVDLIIFKKAGIFLSSVPSEVNIIQIETKKIGLYNRLKYYFSKKLRLNYHNAQNFWLATSKFYGPINDHYDFAIAYNQGLATYYTCSKVDACKKFAWLNIDYKVAGYNASFDLPIYANFDKVIAVSEHAMRSLLEEAAVANQNIDIDVIKDISDSLVINQQANQPIDLPFDSRIITILTVGRLANQKGIELAISASKILKDQGIPHQWFVVGEGPERPKLENLIKQYRLENNFFLIGAYLNPYPLMKNCDIYVQTSLFEGLGLSVIEAAILNKPIVCTDFSTASTILKNEETGLIVKKDPQAIASAINRLIDSKDLCELLSTNLMARKSYDKEVTLKKIYDLLEL